MRQLWGKREVQELIKLYHRGLTPAEIGEQLGRTVKAVESMVWRLQQGPVLSVQMKPWYIADEARIGHLDIETSNLEANAGFMLSWSIKVMGEPGVRSDCITGDEIRTFAFDRRICESLIEQLKKLDIVTTYWGTGFDIPFIRTRCLAWGLDFPQYGTIVHLDLFYAVRSLLKLHRNSLQAACAFFGIEGKTQLDMEVWFKARVGHEQSLKYVLEHNQSDAVILEQLWQKLAPFRKWTRRSL